MKIGLLMLVLSTVRDDVKASEWRLSALPVPQDDALSAIVRALSYADEMGAKAVHVMAGICDSAEALTRLA